MARDRRDQRTYPLLENLYPVQHEPIDGASFEVKLCRAISQALKECPDSREIVAARMAEYLGEGQLSKAMLDAYSSPGREHHCINVKRLMALIHVTGATWLLDFLAQQVGCRVMGDEDVRNAEIGALDKTIDELKERKKTLVKQPPLKASRGRA